MATRLLGMRAVISAPAQLPLDLVGEVDQDQPIMRAARCTGPRRKRLLHLLRPVFRRWLQRLAIAASAKSRTDTLSGASTIVGQHLGVGIWIDDEHVSRRSAQRLANRRDRWRGDACCLSRLCSGLNRPSHLSAVR